MNAIDEDDDDGDHNDDDVVDVEAAEIELSFCNKVLDGGGALLNNDAAVNNEFNSVDACDTDVDMADAIRCDVVVAAEGEPINGT